MEREDYDIVERLCKDNRWDTPILLKKGWYLSADRRGEPLVIELQRGDNRINYYNWSGTQEL